MHAASTLNFVILVLSGLTDLNKGEEVPFSVENNRVIKLLAMRTPRPAPAQTTATDIPDQWNVSAISGTRLNRILNEVETLKRLVAQITQLNYLDEIAEKCVSSIKRRKEQKAQKHWDEIIEVLLSNEAEASNVLRKITLEAYDGFRENILPVVHFVNYTRDFSALHVLLEEMHEYGHLYGGTEVFLFARLIRTNCGTGSELYQELPIGIQYVDSYYVRLINEKNNGVLFYRPKVACRGRHCSPDEAFTLHSDIDELSETERLKTAWVFEPTNTTEFTDDIKFNLRNEFGNKSYLHTTYYTSLSQKDKSSLMVHLVNYTGGDEIRIRVEVSHLVKRLIMGQQNTGSNVLGLSIMGTEDRFDKANDGNWVVYPIEMYRKLSSQTDTSYKCEFLRVRPQERARA